MISEELELILLLERVRLNTAQRAKYRRLQSTSQKLKFLRGATIKRLEAKRLGEDHIDLVNWNSRVDELKEKLTEK